MSYCYRLQADLLRLRRFVLFRFICMHAPCAQVKIISICLDLDFIVIALFSLIVFQFLRDFKLNKGLYKSIHAWSFRIEHKTFLPCCVVNLR